jgi:hypothetical protein
LHSHRARLSVTPCRLTNDFFPTATLVKNTNIIREITACFLPLGPNARYLPLHILYFNKTLRIQIPFILSGKRIHFIQNCYSFYLWNFVETLLLTPNNKMKGLVLNKHPY